MVALAGRKTKKEVSVRMMGEIIMTCWLGPCRGELSVVA